MKNGFKYVLIMLLLSAGTAGKASVQKDSLLISINKYNLQQGDSIEVAAWLSTYTRETNAMTLQLWIDDLATGRRWKLRYPLINGQVAFSLKVGDLIPDGKYAFNFLLQKDFFNLQGSILNEGKKDKTLNYLVISKNKQTIIDIAPVDEAGNFSVGHLLFKDSAFFIFSPAKRNRRNDLDINIKSSLDSAFVPMAVETDIISIGKTDSTKQQIEDTTVKYTFNRADKHFGKMMQEVIVKSTAKKLIDQFEKENVSGLFGGDARVFDGLEDDELSNSTDLFMFLQSRVPGLSSGTDSETGQPVLMWRNHRTEIFINEIKATDFSPYDINTSDIAMIKVFRPGTSISTGSGDGGSIAIYTKTGNYQKTGNRKYSFYLRGYTGLEADWY